MEAKHMGLSIENTTNNDDASMHTA